MPRKLLNRRPSNQRPPKPPLDDSHLLEPPVEFHTPEELIEAQCIERDAEVIDKWWYRDRDGKGLLLRYRLEADDSDVVLQTVSSDGLWVPGWPPTKKVPLYRVYEGFGKSPVFVVEGEYAADSAIAMGLPAVTSAGGPKDVERTDWRPLAGREVVISPENSDAGRTFARAVARMVLPLDPAPVVRMLALPGLEEGQDISDFGWELKLSPQALADRVRQLARRLPAMTLADLRGAPVLQPYQAVAATPVRWLWPWRVPIGKPMVIYGDCNAGKSMVALDLAARVSAGAEWPDGGGRAPCGNVILMSREDHMADTIRPRLDRAGADPQRIFALNTVSRVIEAGGESGEIRRDITLDDLADLERAIEIIGNVRLVVIDPLSAYFPGDVSARRRIRAAIAGLAALADRRGVAVITTAELGGRDGLGYSANMALMSVVRTAWLLAPVPMPVEVPVPGVVQGSTLTEVRDRILAEAAFPEGVDVTAPSEVSPTQPGPAPLPSRVESAGLIEPPLAMPVEVMAPRGDRSPAPNQIEEPAERMLLVSLKRNSGNLGGGLALWLGENAVEWEPAPVAPRGVEKMLGTRAVPELLAATLPSHPPIVPPRPGPKALSRMTAEQWLREQLAGGPVAVGSSRCRAGNAAGTLYAAAKAAGMGWTTIRRAFDEMHGVSEKCPTTGRQTWRLPAPDQIQACAAKVVADDPSVRSSDVSPQARRAAL